MNNKKSKSNKFRLREILNFPSELEDVFAICKNEIDLSEGNLVHIEFYSRIYSDCLLEHHKLTYGHNNITATVRETIVKSNSTKDAKFQFKAITNPHHILPSVLLKMLNDFKPLRFVNPDLTNLRVHDAMKEMIKKALIGHTHYSKTRQNSLLLSFVAVI